MTRCRSWVKSDNETKSPWDRPLKINSKGPETISEGSGLGTPQIKKDGQQNGVKFTIGCLSSISLSVLFLFICYLFLKCACFLFISVVRAREWASRMKLNLVAWEECNFAG